MNKSKSVDLLNGSISGGIIRFCIPIFLGQLLQQLYNIADAWVVGNFCDNNAFAAISGGGSLSFFILGFFGGMGAGGGIVVSRYFGAGDKENLSRAIHANVLFGLICSLVATLLGLLLVPKLLLLTDTPADVMPYSLLYFNILFGGIVTTVMYNTLMSVMRSVGDSFHPLMYLLISSVLNIGLDILMVAVFDWGVAGAATATVIAQGVSVLPCFIRLLRMKDGTGIKISKIFVWSGDMMKQILIQGLPMGLQNSVISIGNMVVQKNINAFGAFAMSGMGAYAKVEGFVFLPITSISMAIPTFISQNLGASKYDRAKKGARFGIFMGVILAELIGVVFLLSSKSILGFFVDSPEAIEYGNMHVHVVALFYFLLAFSHCAAGVMRGAGKAIIPMITMLAFWCAFRIVYVTTAIHFRPIFTTISSCYPITWSLSSLVFIIWLLTKDWTRSFEK